MKSRISLMVIISLVILCFSCASMADIAANRAVRADYLSTFIPNSNTFTTIEGNVTNTEMVIFKNSSGVGYFDNIFLFKQQVNNNPSLLMFNVNFQGSNWRFIDALKIRVDDELLTLSANNNPKRDTMSTQMGVRVFEEVYFTISNDLLDKILNCNQLAFQYTGSPLIEITKQEEIQKIKDFLK